MKMEITKPETINDFVELLDKIIFEAERLNINIDAMISYLEDTYE